MLPILLIGIIGGIIWNALLISDSVYRDVRRKYRKEIKQIHKEQHK
jgi:hypothetical protein